MPQKFEIKLPKTNFQESKENPKIQGGNSQNFLLKFIRFFLTLSLKILILLRLKVVFEADIIKR